MLEIIQNPNETEVAFLKRKAYFERLIKPRFNYGDYSLDLKKECVKPLSEEQKKEIDNFWSIYIDKEKLEDFIDYRWYSIYNQLNNNKSFELKYYIPDTFYYAFVDEYFTNPQWSNPCDDKNLYDLLFNDILRPKTIIRKIGDLILDKNYSKLTLEEAIKLCSSYSSIIFKTSKFSCGGSGINFWDADESTERIKQILNDSTHLIGQEIVNQHSELKKLNPTSLNTVRILTLLQKDNVKILSSVVRMGKIHGARVDNASSGGIVCGIDTTGRLKEIAYDTCGNCYLKHPNGTKFEDITIPNFNKCIELVEKLSYRVADITRLVSWDLAIDNMGNAVLIEFNTSFGQIDFHQLCNGPILGEHPEEVLNEVFSKSYTLRALLNK